MLAFAGCRSQANVLVLTSLEREALLLSVKQQRDGTGCLLP